METGYRCWFSNRQLLVGTYKPNRHLYQNKNWHLYVLHEQKKKKKSRLESSHAPTSRCCLKSPIPHTSQIPRIKLFEIPKFAHMTDSHITDRNIFRNKINHKSQKHLKNYKNHPKNSLGRRRLPPPPIASPLAGRRHRLRRTAARPSPSSTTSPPARSGERGDSRCCRLRHR